MHFSHHIVDAVRVSLLALGAAMFATVWASVAPKAKGEPAAVQATVDDAACRQIVAHQPAQGVAYRPGAERGVAAADLSGGLTLEPQDIAIDLRLPLRDVAAGRADRLGNSEVQVGAVSFDQGGDRIFLSGQPAADPATHAIAAICATRLQAR